MPNNDCEIQALNFLARREHSRLELERKLSAKEYDKNIIQEVLHKLKDKNLQSDERFAANYTKARADRGYGPVRIALELRERGVSDSIINEALNNYSELYELWNELAANVRRKKFGSSLPVKYSFDHKKQINFLYYKGFSQEQIASIFITD
jgi:regulatory protein